MDADFILQLEKQGKDKSQQTTVNSQQSTAPCGVLTLDR